MVGLGAAQGKDAVSNLSSNHQTQECCKRDGIGFNILKQNQIGAGERLGKSRIKHLVFNGKIDKFFVTIGAVLVGRSTGECRLVIFI